MSDYAIRWICIGMILHRCYALCVMMACLCQLGPDEVHIIDCLMLQVMLQVMSFIGKSVRLRKE